MPAPTVYFHPDSTIFPKVEFDGATKVLEGQLVGGAAQGIAGALMEEFRYTDDGQPLATTLADYLVPTAGEVPPIGVLISEDWPAESNALPPADRQTIPLKPANIS